MVNFLLVSMILSAVLERGIKFVLSICTYYYTDKYLMHQDEIRRFSKRLLLGNIPSKQKKLLFTSLLLFVCCCFFKAKISYWN